MTSALPGSALYGHDGPRGGGDELFGPLPTSIGVVGTPIFEAVASAWFRDDERGPARDDWNTAGDREWREAPRAPRAPTRRRPPPAACRGAARVTAWSRPPRLPPDRAARRAGARAGPRPAVDLPAWPAAGPPPRRRCGAGLRRIAGVDLGRLVAGRSGRSDQAAARSWHIQGRSAPEWRRAG